MNIFINLRKKFLWPPVLITAVLITLSGCLPPRDGLQTFIEGEREPGEPAVIFESGGTPINFFDMAGMYWISTGITGAVSQQTMTVAYNRAGQGWSEFSSTPRDAENIVNELRTMLNEREIAPPYILVGHSLGNYYMQYFARNFPNEVVGLVMVDGSQLDAYNSCIDWFGDIYEPYCKSYDAEYLANLFAELGYDDEPGFSEIKLMDLSYQQIASSPPMQEMPFVMLASTDTGAPEATQEQWDEQFPGLPIISTEDAFEWAYDNHYQQLAQVSGGVHIPLEGASHALITKTHAQDITNQILDVLTQVQQAQ